MEPKLKKIKIRLNYSFRRNFSFSCKLELYNIKFKNMRITDIFYWQTNNLCI